MSDNDHIDAQWLHAAPPPSRRRGRGCALSLLVLILVLAGVLFYPRLQAWFTPVPAVQIQVESSVLPDTAPNCTANPRTAAVLRLAMRDQTDAAVYDCDAATLEACMAELLDDPELWVRSYQYTVHGGLNAHITVTFDWVYPDDGPARRAQLARTADGLLAAAPAGDYERALYLYDWLLTHVRYVARETYDQTAYAAVCEGEAVCGGIADAYVYLLERGGIPARVITGTSRSADGTADSLGRGGARRRGLLLRPHLGSAGRRERGGAAGLPQPHVVRPHGRAHGRAPHGRRSRPLAGQPRQRG